MFSARRALDDGSMKQMHETSKLRAPNQEERLLVTFFLFSYNQEKYIEDACKAALAQTYSPLEIIFSDDCSSDNTFKLITDIVCNYTGNHKIVLNRNQENLGLIGHVNKSFEMSSGELIVVAAGDDISLPNRVKSIVDVYEKNKRKSLVIHSSALKINDSNELVGLYFPPVIEQKMDIFEIAASQGLYIGATGAWSRSIYKDFGPIVFKDSYEDLVLGFRAAMKGSLVYIDEPLVMYRFGVGISAIKKHSFFDIKSKVRRRIKLLITSKSVYEQRMSDLGCIGGDVYALKKVISKKLFFEEQKINFYKKPFLFFRLIFSFNLIIAIKVIFSEFKFLIRN